MLIDTDELRKAIKGQRGSPAVRKSIKALETLTLQYGLEIYNDYTLSHAKLVELTTGTTIALCWGTEDVLQRAEELDVLCTEEQAKDILEKAEHYHDANYGICWDTFDVYLWELQKDSE